MQSGSRRFSIETALGLFGLDKYELMWEKAHDTKVLLAWGNNTVLVSFRGSASLTNALADVQVLLCSLPQHCPCSCPSIAYSSASALLLQLLYGNYEPCAKLPLAAFRGSCSLMPT